MVVNKVCGTKNNMVMDVAFVDMGSQNIFVFAAQNRLGQLHGDYCCWDSIEDDRKTNKK